MLYTKNLHRKLFAVATAAIVLSSCQVVASDKVITLRLDEPQSSTSPAGAQSEIVVPPSRQVSAPMPAVKGACAVLMDAATGQVLYAKNPHMHRPNASTTKMMTAILMIEHCKMTDIITASKNASETPFTSLHLKPGEQITVHDLLTGMLIRSANDAAVAAAEHIAGSTQKFAQMMNRKAAEIGCFDTNFVTPNGLYNKNHYSSAYDLCLIARYGFRYPEFNEAVCTRKYCLASRTINKNDIVVFSKSKFLKDYPGADGVKSGYIKQAGYCYVGSATRNGWRLVSSVLKSDNAGRDTIAMMDYGFANYQHVNVAKAGSICGKAVIGGGDSKLVAVAPKQTLMVSVPRTGAKIITRFEFNQAQAPILKGAKLGKMVALVNGKQAAKVDLCATKDVGISLARRTLTWFKTCGILTACLVVGGKYGTAFTKGTRRRRRRVTTSLRGYNRYR